MQEDLRLNGGIRITSPALRSMRATIFKTCELGSSPVAADCKRARGADRFRKLLLSTFSTSFSLMASPASSSMQPDLFGAALPIPSFVDPLRAKAARWIGLQSREFVHALVSEYRPGAPLGWHRDVPQFEVIVGVSLGGACQMRLRPYKPGGRNARLDVIALTLKRRSAYVMRGVARWGWQHSIVATKELRCSITLRTASRQHA